MDWIEIYNPRLGPPVDLLGCSITDKEDDLNWWTFPNDSLAFNDRLVLFASGKDRPETGPRADANTIYNQTRAAWELHAFCYVNWIVFLCPQKVPDETDAG